MEIYVNISFISILSLFLVFKYDFIILPVSQLQRQQVMTSQIRSNIEYLIQTYYIVIEIDEESSHNGASFNTI